MKKVHELTIEEAFVQLLDASYDFIYKNTKTFINLYELKYKRLQKEVIEHEKIEPFKIFKKSHKRWLKKRDQLNVELEESFNILMEEYRNYEDLVGLS